MIIASNVFEHLSNDREVARHLLERCEALYIVVPYKERLKANSEHVNSYDERYFDSVAPSDTLVFDSEGWTHMGWDLYWNIWAKNLIRPLLGKSFAQRGRQIMFRFGS